ncbi:hypothetical protein KIW84_031289 [Lathyrus oleraceus]|uniref:Uncharacterized protein n=1 Tax=Pisum sativum TaxID=3888 RepID=A0A9D4XVE9_PEA|nr:hypothetical protein KIW84_031289 [Pisum sativum]
MNIWKIFTRGKNWLDLPRLHRTSLDFGFNMLDGSNGFSGFPSSQSGSYSALMQSVLNSTVNYSGLPGFHHPGADTAQGQYNSTCHGLYKAVVLHDDETKAGKLSANHNVEPPPNAILCISKPCQFCNASSRRNPKFRELSTSGLLLLPRAGHSTTSFAKNLFFSVDFTDAQNLYNDLYMLDIDTGIWTNVTTATNCPSATFSVAGDCLDPFKGGVLVFIGGCNKSLEALGDLYYLYTCIAKESEQRLEKLSLKKQLKLKCREEKNLIPGQNQVMVGYGVGADIG